METFSESVLSTWPILSATAALIAFHIGTYTLVGRERKSPYIINSIFPIFLFCLVAASLALVALMATKAISTVLLNLSLVVLVVAFILSIYVVFKTTIRFAYFVDHLHLKQLPPIRSIVRKWEDRKTGPTYTSHAVSVSQDVERKIEQLLEPYEDAARPERTDTLRSLAVGVKFQGQASNLLSDLAKIFLEAGYSIQYLTASRHPVEFILHLRERLKGTENDLHKCRERIVSIDAYSPHFAFLDSVYRRKDSVLAELGIRNVRSKMTYAGMHSASSHAFNITKERANSQTRMPTLVIYEDTYALSDLESPDQYRIFVRHVMPSERMWDGMLTVFVESAQADYDWKVVSSYANIAIDMRDTKKKAPLNG